MKKTFLLFRWTGKLWLLLLLIYNFNLSAQTDLAQCRIKNISSGKYLSIANSSTSNGAQLVQATDNGSNTFKWTLTYNSAGYYTITNVQSGKAISLPENSQTAGSLLAQQPLTGSINQQWKIKPVGTNAYTIQSTMSSGYVITNPTGNTEGALMNINPYNGSSIQQWAIESTINNAKSYAANSTNLIFNTPSNAILKMLKTKIAFSAYNSYFETLTFNGGYAGLQLTNDNSRGSYYISISSLWDPAGGSASNAEYAAPGVTSIHGDNGEGSATTTIAPFNWKYNVYYNIVVRSWERDGKLHLGTFINNLEDNTWFHQTTITTTNDGKFLGKGEASFIENWAAGADNISANNIRKAFYKDCWNMNISGEWEKPTSAKVNSNLSRESLARAGIWDKSFDGGYDTTEGAYYMQTGGLTRKNVDFGNNNFISLPLQPNQDIAPILTTGKVNNVTFNYVNGQVQINWVNDNTKSPQLISNVEVLDQNGQVVSTTQETLPQKRNVTYSANLPPGNTYTARVTIIDIFNQQSAAKTSAPFTIPVKGCIGGSLQVNATTPNASSYQWEYQNANGTWSNYPEGNISGYASFTGTQTATMTVSNIGVYYIDHPNTVRAKIILNNGSTVYSAVQQWQAQGISQQPSNSTACAGKSLQLSAIANGTAYQWQYQNSNGTWSNYTEGNVSGYASFAGTKTTTMTVSNIGNYYIDHPNQARLVVYGQNGCTVYSNTITWQATNCTTQKKSQITTEQIDGSTSKVTVYPNPVQDELTITMPGTNLYNIQIINALGQELYKAEASKNTIKIPFLNKAAGIYYVRITDTKSGATQSFQVRK